tara:strand:+ start:1448 stop:1690 length:243 start_codon:yes stop_codon:yes gene_type:complete
MMNKFRTKAGRLTHYALACGYIEMKEKENLRLELWHEGACFHVKAHDFNIHNRVFWESFNTLKNARRFYDINKKQLFKAQ